MLMFELHVIFVLIIVLRPVLETSTCVHFTSRDWLQGTSYALMSASTPVLYMHTRNVLYKSRGLCALFRFLGQASIRNILMCSSCAITSSIHRAEHACRNSTSVPVCSIHDFPHNKLNKKSLLIAKRKGFKSSQLHYSSTTYHRRFIPRLYCAGDVCGGFHNICGEQHSFNQDTQR